MITINFDFTTGNEISYQEGLLKKDNFETHVLDFFCFDTEVDDIIVLKKDGSFIKRSNLLKENNPHCRKEIRIAHNIRKILVAGGFDFIFDDINLEQFYNIDSKQDLLNSYLTLSSLLQNKRFIEYDFILTNIDLKKIKTVFIIALLRMAFPYKNKLKCWDLFFKKAEDEFKALELDSNVILKGLI